MQVHLLNELLNVQGILILLQNYEMLANPQKTLFIVSELDCQLQVQKRDLNLDVHIDILVWFVQKIKALIDGYKYIIQSDIKHKIDFSFTEIVEFIHLVDIAQANIRVIVLYDVLMVETTLMQRGMFTNQYL